MEIIYTKRFQKHYKKLDKYIQGKFQESIVLFRADPWNSKLRNHPLEGEYIGYRSIDITGDYRVVFAERSEGIYELVELIDIGTHSQLYG